MASSSLSSFPQRRYLLCVTTSQPTASMVGGGGGALTMVCPQTGSMAASLTISGDLSSTTATRQQHQLLGISSMSVLDASITSRLTGNSNNNSVAPLAVAYGGKSTAAAGTNNDCAAMLISLSSHNPKVHWKARLSEANLTAGVVVTKCGHYAVGGGASGTLYVWSTLTGHLLATVSRAHYRAITCLHLTNDLRHVVTGGADGMVHMFALVDLVQSTTSSKQVLPIRTWSQHAVPITCVAGLQSGDRIISASQDGLLVVMETFSEAILATIQLPEGITSVAVHHQRIWVGGSQGTVWCLDLDVYAMHQTIQLGANIATTHPVGTTQEQSTSANSSPSYKTALKGHLHSVTSLAVWGGEGQQEFLASGDASGTLRIWDLKARVCIRIVRPWSNTTTDGPMAAAAAAAASTTTTNGNPKKATKKQQQHFHAISTIHVMDVTEPTTTTGMDFNGAVMTMTSTMTNSNHGGKFKSGASSWTSRFPPLQKYPPTQQQQQSSTDSNGSLQPIQWTPVPLWNTTTTSSFWDVSAINYGIGRKRPRVGGNSTAAETAAAPAASNPVTAENAPAQQGDETINEKDQEILRLQQQLQEANSTIARWEKVNNQLMTKLQQK